MADTGVVVEEVEDAMSTVPGVMTTVLVVVVVEEDIVETGTMMMTVVEEVVTATIVGAAHAVVAVALDIAGAAAGELLRGIESNLLFGYMSI